MDCSRARLALSERMDGQRLHPRRAAAAERHLESCAACRAFQRDAWRIRQLARFEVTERVPDLVDGIMAAVTVESARTSAITRTLERAPTPRRPSAPRSGSTPRWPRLARRIAPLAAALIVGALSGSLVVGGPWHDTATRIPNTVAAADVSRQVLRAAARLDAYHASFRVTEWHYAPDVPVRELDLNVWFRAPERLRLEVVDHTAYPDRAETPNDLLLVASGSNWYSAGPAPCPQGGPGTCPEQRVTVRDRIPFSAAAPVPTDVVVPVSSLADANSLQVLGTGEALGREGVRVQLTYAQARPLFAFQEIGGGWRPFFPQDRVVVLLDARSWFPLSWRVYPAPTAERVRWASRNLLPPEPPEDPIFIAEARDLDERAPAAGTFDIPEPAGRNAPSREDTQSQGAREVTLAEAARRSGHEPIAPETLGGLPFYRVVVPNSGEETIVSYAGGLSWIQVGETHDWDGPSLYGPLDPQAQELRIPGGSVGYYQPADEERGRRLAIHAADTDLYLETNLSKGALLRAAAELGVRGLPLPESWRVREAPGGQVQRVPATNALEEAPFDVPLPSELPEGYVLASAELVRVAGTTGVNVYFQQEGSALGGAAIRLHEEPADALPTASAANQSTLELPDGTGARWTPSRHRLEWVTADSLYLSLDGPGLSLEDAVTVAASMEVVT